MSIQSNPKKAVLTLCNRLNEAAERSIGPINESTIEENEEISEFQSVGVRLRNLIIILPDVKLWEDNVQYKFTELKFQVYKTLSNAKKTGDDFKENLKLVGQKIDELTVLASQISGNTGSVSSGKESQPEETRKHEVLKEWKELQLENIIFSSSAMRNLMVSYQHLDEHLRLCFLFLSVFPENAQIKKRSLIYWWIGEGLITQTDKYYTAEEKGEDVFQELIKQGLLIPYPENVEEGSLVVNTCKMHPWIRRMAMYLAQEAELFDFDFSGTPSYVTSRSRRACLVLGSQISAAGTVNSSGGKRPKEDNLLTVFNASEQYLDFDPGWLLKLKKVVVLHLGRWCYSTKHHIEVENEEFLKDLGSQKHLKYLSLRGISQITKLPPSIIHLFSLEILDLKACHNLRELPSDIGSLRRLTHLDVSDCRLLESIPMGLEKLTALQVLKGFVIGKKKKTPCQIADLAKLTKLRRLSIFIGNDAEIQEGEFAKLKDMGKLRCLTIWWGVKSAEHRKFIDLSFPPQLEKLDLRGIPQGDPPKELKASTLTKLKKLYIRGGKIKRLDNEEAGKWKVEILRVKYLENFKLDWKKLKNTFPDLRYLEVKCGKSAEDKGREDSEKTYEVDFVLTSKFQIEDYYEENEIAEEEQFHSPHSNPLFEISEKISEPKEFEFKEEQISEKERNREVNVSKEKGKQKVI